MSRFSIRVLLVLMTASGLTTSATGQLIVAHRGASRDAPENTRAAFELAWQQGADGIECDFRLTADGEVVCIHDKTTGRTAGVERSVAGSRLADLQQLDVGAWMDERFAGQRILTLAEVLRLVPQNRMVVIELKCGPEIVAPTVTALNQSDLENEQILVISFQADTIATIRQKMPGLRTHWLSGYEPDGEVGPWEPDAAAVVETIRGCGAAGFGSEARTGVFDDRFVGGLRAAGIGEFHVWTVDDPEVARFYRDLGAWGITTNRPGFIRRALRDPGNDR